MREGKTAQAGGDARVQDLGCLGPLTPRETAHQSQHGRCGHTGYRGAKCHAQALDRFGKCGADARHTAGAFQCKHRAIEGHDHAQKSAQHAQHDQQSDQIGREGRSGQTASLALHTLSHRVLQRGGQGDQPVVQLRQVRRDLRQGVVQGLGVGTVLAQLPGAKAIHRRDDRGHGQDQQVGAGHCGCYPQDRQGAQSECGLEGISFHGASDVSD